MIAQKKIIENLHSNDIIVVMKTIESLRHNGKDKNIDNILELLLRTKDGEIKRAICNLLNDLKDQKSAPVIMCAIHNITYKNILQVIVESCWQSGLDYSSYLSDFINLMVHENYYVALEAFTVVENMIGSFTTQELENNIAQLKMAINDSDKNKSYLFVEMINVLKGFIPLQTKYSE